MVSVEAVEAVRCLVRRPPSTAVSLGRFFLSIEISPQDLIVFTDDVELVRIRGDGRVKSGEEWVSVSWGGGGVFSLKD